MQVGVTSVLARNPSKSIGFLLQLQRMTSELLSAQLRQHALATQRNPDDLTTSLSAIDGYERILASGQVSAEYLSVIQQASVHNHRGPMYVGTYLLIDLSSRFPDIHEVWLHLAGASRAHVRRIAAACMADYRVPIETAQVVLGVLRDDRFSQVLQFALQSARSRKLVSLQKPLAAALARSANRTA
jgi:hypothetical protein